MSMTREEAIKAFKEIKANAQDKLGKKYAAGCERYYQDKIDLADAALSALRPVSREQVERMQGEWIDLRECYNDVPKRQCSHCGKVLIGLETPFCEACGSPMTDEAVDMVMERLEALRDE